MQKQKDRKKYYRQYYKENKLRISKFQKRYRKLNGNRIRKWHREYQKLYKNKYKLLVFTHYSRGKPKCNCCGETNIGFLTIDHIQNDGHIQRRKHGTGSGITLLLWLKRNNFPKGFQILCYNCNCGRAYNTIAPGVCPHVQT